MQVTLDAIKFNHDPDGTTTGAFNIRRNETEAVQFPEWERGRPCMTPECSPVAYSIDGLPEAIIIKASFSSNDAPPEGVYFKALEDRDDRKVPRPLNVLGSSDEPLVTFQNGKAIDVPFTFATGGILNSGASASDLKWQWQFSVDEKRTWTYFQATEHRVYTVPSLPSCPWEPRSNASSNIQVPWTEALEYACHWAAGVTKDLDLAATMITRRIYSLGKSLLRWQQGSSYTGKHFDLTKFLALFQNGIGAGQTLNCDDCAAIVSTFANLLGAQLSQSSMGHDFKTNPILLVGDSHWRPVRFEHHSVAWKGNCTEDDELFDACLQVDGDRKPDLPPQFPKQPTKMVFGGRSRDSYQSALSTDNFRPLPNTKQRRKFGTVVYADQAIQSTGNFDRYKDHYDFKRWPSAPGIRTASSVGSLRFFQSGLVFEHWSSQPLHTFNIGNVATVFHAILQKDAPLPRQLVDLNFYECADGVDPNEVLLRILSSFEAFLEPSSDKSLGELAFTDGANIAFRHGRFIAVVRSVGRETLDVHPVAGLLYDFLKLTVT